MSNFLRTFSQNLKKHKLKKGRGKVEVLTNVCWNFEKKIEGIFGKTSFKFWKSFRKFLINSGKLWIKFV